ncbi:restriction endonuclease subunit S [Streptococcus sanguinis]|uniref:restriction endonuclease subunit S n=1 Tax=Streptococcus sanguinis TaxID=1305 RepID=UPI002283E8E4|nr:restriction endonuclease subunit S [Streptococcus sanguinis]MCY7029300.1 restriction endonuclease subunit S [Streptococcus sanguinis]
MENIPKIRYQEFTDQWKKQKIGSITTSYSGGTPKSSNKNYYSGEIPFIRSGELNSDMTALFINEEALKDSSAKLVEKGDILYALYGATSGEVSISKIKGAINQAILAIKPHEYYSPEFIVNFLKKEKDNILDKYLQGGQGNLSAAIIKGLEISLPTYSEQSAIGSLFCTLDDLLADYKENLVNYKAFKASMLSKMFPKSGQTVPEIRLAGFEGEWKEKILGDLADIVRGASPRPIQDPKWFDSSSEVGWLRISDVTNQNGRIHNLEQKISKLGQEKTRVLTESHLLISIAATVGKPVINYVKTGVHDGFLIFMNARFDREFMFQWLEMFRGEWNKYGQPGSQVNLNSDIVKNHRLRIPDLLEQQAIGSFFSNLDTLISSYQDKISQLETLKKKLLQDMFV